jgi:hypothetical protein
VPFDPASPLRKERMVRTVPRDRGSSLASITADFCNTIGTKRTYRDVYYLSAFVGKADNIHGSPRSAFKVRNG